MAEAFVLVPGATHGRPKRVAGALRAAVMWSIRPIMLGSRGLGFRGLGFYHVSLA